MSQGVRMIEQVMYMSHFANLGWQKNIDNKKRELLNQD